VNWTWQLDGWIVVAGVLCAVSAALVGNFLLLRRMSMLGDAISHAVLPGLAVAYLVTGSRGSTIMFAGAVLTGVLTAMFTQWIRDAGKVDEGASMGVVFTTLFSLGLVLIVQAADHVDLDAGCVLYGNLESIHFQQAAVIPAWLGNAFGLVGTSAMEWRAPAVVIRLVFVLMINAVFVWLLFKELRVSAFDPALSTTMGYNSTLMHYLLMTLVAVTAVASFESVGNILVVAMFVVPPAAASLITGRLSPMIWWSVGIAALSAVGGHWLAVDVPHWFGMPSTNTAGAMAVASGLLFVVAWMFGPRQGLVWKWSVRQLLAMQILQEDILALLYRWREKSGEGQSLPVQRIRGLLLASRFGTWLSLVSMRRRGWVSNFGDQVLLTDSGMRQASSLVRAHRLWEQYLVNELDFNPGRIHDKAERLEHFTSDDLRKRLGRETSGVTTDPHGAPIPPETATSE